MLSGWYSHETGVDGYMSDRMSWFPSRNWDRFVTVIIGILSGWLQFLINPIIIGHLITVQRLFKTVERLWITVQRLCKTVERLLHVLGITLQISLYLSFECSVVGTVMKRVWTDTCLIECPGFRLEIGTRGTHPTPFRNCYQSTFCVDGRFMTSGTKVVWSFYNR